MGFFSNLFDPGKDDRNEAGQMARDAVIDNVSASGAFGGGSFNDGRFTSDLGQFGGIFEQIMGQLGTSGEAGQQNFANLFGAGGAATSALSGDFMDPALLEQITGTIQSGLGTLGQTAQQLGAGQLDISNQIAAPRELEARQALAQNLFAQGRGGSTGGQLQTEGLGRVQSDAALKREMMANQFGMDVRQQALGQVNQGFGQIFQAKSAADQRALQRFGIAGNLFDAGRTAQSDIFGNINQGLAGLGAIQGFGNQNFMQALNAEIARSNSQLGGSNIFAQNAANTPNIGMALLEGASGAVAGAASAGTFSDERLKKNIQRIGTLGDFGWYSWDWNEIAQKLGITDETYGVIAQEVAGSRPDVISERDGYLTVNYGALLNG